jgi:hypothetical protein
VQIQTLNGSFDFRVYRLKNPQGSSNYLALSGQFRQGHYQTKALCAYAIRYACQLSYQSVSKLITERSGNSGLSDQYIHGLVLAKAGQLGLAQQAYIDRHSQLQRPVLEASDLYERASKELIWMEDGISVAKQKDKRDKLAKPTKERTLTDAIRFADPDGKFTHLVAAQQVSLTQLATAHLKAHYSGQAVSVVLISDGSRTIGNRCGEIFGGQYQPILDWYHLQKKMKEHLSMIAHSKEQKTDYLKQMMPLLWKGNGAEVIEILLGIKARNAVKQAELVAYLRKNRLSIINYEKRKAAGKPIGSGAMEKTVDILVAQRQKQKAMSWSTKGSTALAVVKADLLNQATENLQ